MRCEPGETLQKQAARFHFNMAERELRHRIDSLKDYVRWNKGFWGMWILWLGLTFYLGEHWAYYLVGLFGAAMWAVMGRQLRKDATKSMRRYSEAEEVYVGLLYKIEGCREEEGH